MHSWPRSSYVEAARGKRVAVLVPSPLAPLPVQSGVTADVVAPTVVRHLYPRGATAAGRITLALGCALLVVQHHRAQTPPDAMLVLDLLRVVRHGAVSEGEPMQCVL